MDSGKMILGRPVAARKKRINDYLRFAMFATTAAITTTFQWGCIKEDHGSSSDTSGDGVAVYISMDVPRTAETRALTDPDENTIKTLDVLVFLDNGAGQDETYLYSTHATDFAPSGATTTVKVGLQKSNATDKHRLVFLANLRDEITTVKGSWTTAMTKEQVLQSVTFDAYGAAETDETKRVWDTSQPDPRFLPMWGESDGTYVVTSTLMGSTIGTIKMLRSVATVNIILNPDPQGDPQGFPNFKLKDIKVYNVPQKGYGAPDPDNLASMVAEFPTYSSTFSRNASTVVAYETNSTLQEDIYGFIKKIYIPEAPNTDGDPVTPVNIDDLDQTCLVISGYNDGSPKETWYRIDFIDRLSATENLRVDILRNHRYTFFITSVDGPGYETEDEAFKSAPMNLEADVIYWDENEMTDVWFDGRYYYSVSPLEREHWAAAVTGNEIKIKTDYPKWSYELSDLPTPGDPAANPINVNWLTVTSHTAGTENYDPDTAVELKYNVAKNTDGVDRTAYIHITAGRVTMTVRVVQQPWYITEIRVSPEGDMFAAEQQRVITVHGLFDDIPVRAWDMYNDIEISRGTVPTNVSLGNASNVTLTVPAYYNGLNTAGMRPVAFEFFNAMHNEWRPIKVDDQEAYYVATANRVGDNITWQGGGLTITLTGNIPSGTIGRVVINGTNTVVSTNSTTVVGSQMTLSRNQTTNTRTLLAQYAWNGQWLPAGATFNQAAPSGNIVGNMVVYPTTSSGQVRNGCVCPNGWSPPTRTQTITLYNAGYIPFYNGLVLMAQEGTTIYFAAVPNTKVPGSWNAASSQTATGMWRCVQNF